MYTVTFYSYRGGVGRTTALVNVAADLALRGRKVLLVDFDLEAPSLPSFELLRPKGGTHPGLVEFIDEYLRSGKAPAIRDYVYQAKPVGNNLGELWVMPAGRGGDDYWRALDQIDWKELYNRQDGFLLFAGIKSQWQRSLKPDYVLIDARAGINNRLPICTRQLPDAVVMLFTPDSAGAEKCLLSEEQPLGKAGDQEGFRRVLRDVIEMTFPAGQVHLEESLQSTPLRIDVFLVATKVPDLDGYDLDKSTLNALVFPGDPDDVPVLVLDLAATIPHSPELLFEKQVVTNLPSRKRLPQEFRRLADALIRGNCCTDREGAQTLIEELRKHPVENSGRLDQLIKQSEQEQDPEMLAQAASCLFNAGRKHEAIRTLDRAINFKPAGDRYFWHRTGPGSGSKPVCVALADSILWQRAMYHKDLDRPRAVDDLLRILDRDAPSLLRGVNLQFESKSTQLRTEKPLTSGILPGIDPYVASAFEQLRRFAPDKIQEALQKHRIQQLSPELRQSLVAGAPVTPPSAPPEPTS